MAFGDTLNLGCLPFEECSPRYDHALCIRRYVLYYRIHYMHVNTCTYVRIRTCMYVFTVIMNCVHLYVTNSIYCVYCTCAQQVQYIHVSYTVYDVYVLYLFTPYVCMCVAIYVMYCMAFNRNWRH